MRGFWCLLGCVGLMACAPPIPDSGPQALRSEDYLQRREADLQGPGAVPRTAQVGDPLADALSDANRPRGDTPSNIAARTADGDGGSQQLISDEQDFEAVAARESIESDRERLERLRAQYQVVQPGALPRRSGQQSSNIVAYALSTTNQVGEQIYRRSNPLRHSASLRACAEYPSADMAQIAFLDRGGPQRDRLSLDPDGDGFACDWDPGPYRGVARTQR